MNFLRTFRDTLPSVALRGGPFPCILTMFLVIAFLNFFQSNGWKLSHTLIFIFLVRLSIFSHISWPFGHHLLCLYALCTLVIFLLHSLFRVKKVCKILPLFRDIYSWAVVDVAIILLQFTISCKCQTVIH